MLNAALRHYKIVHYVSKFKQIVIERGILTCNQDRIFFFILFLLLLFVPLYSLGFFFFLICIKQAWVVFTPHHMTSLVSLTLPQVSPLSNKSLRHCPIICMGLAGFNDSCLNERGSGLFTGAGHLNHGYTMEENDTFPQQPSAVHSPLLSVTN